MFTTGHVGQLFAGEAFALATAGEKEPLVWLKIGGLPSGKVKTLLLRQGRVVDVVLLTVVVVVSDEEVVVLVLVVVVVVLEVDVLVELVVVVVLGQLRFRDFSRLQSVESQTVCPQMVQLVGLISARTLCIAKRLPTIAAATKTVTFRVLNSVILGLIEFLTTINSANYSKRLVGAMLNAYVLNCRQQGICQEKCVGP